MTNNTTWIKEPFLVGTSGLKGFYKYGEKLSEVSKDGKTIKTDSIYDFDNDGRADLKVYKKAGQISVFINQNQDKTSSPQWTQTDIYGQTDSEIEENIKNKHITPTILKLTSQKTENKENLFTLPAWAKEEKNKETTEKKNTTYTVEKGDYLDKIARKYGCTVEDLVKENNLKNKDVIIQVGQKLKIPVKNVKNSDLVQNETEKNPTTTNVEKTTTLKNEEDFFKDLGFSESSGRYNVTKGKHLGKYQMAPLALMDTGYINPKTGKFTGKDGIYSKEDFLNSPKVQEKAIRLYMQKQWSYIKTPGASKIGQKINGIEITYSGLLAAAHLVGQGHVKRYINSNGKSIKKDGNGTSIESYLRKFANYDVSEFVGNSKIAYK